MPLLCINSDVLPQLEVMIIFALSLFLHLFFPSLFRGNGPFSRKANQFNYISLVENSLHEAGAIVVLMFPNATHPLEWKKSESHM